MVKPLYESLMRQQGACMAAWYDMPDNNKQARPKLNETCRGCCKGCTYARQKGDSDECWC